MSRKIHNIPERFEELTGKTIDDLRQALRTEMMITREMTQSEYADHIGVHQVTVSQFLGTRNKREPGWISILCLHYYAISERLY